MAGGRVVTVAVVVVVLLAALPPPAALGPGRSKSLRFVALGDWGGLPVPPYTTPLEQTTAHRLGIVAETLGADFVVSLGDNFYFDGVRDSTDRRFKETFEDIFSAESLRDVPWYVLAGNHDHSGNVSAQIAYSNSSKRWNFPDYYYSVDFSLGGGGAAVTVTLLMLDTVLLCGNSDDFAGGQPRGPGDSRSAGKQLHWIRNKLENSRADFLLVAGHYPVWSVSEHGPTDCLVRHLQPLLTQHRVSAYLCGHDHNLQLIQESVGATAYVVSGAGNFMDNSTRHRERVPEGWLRFFYADVVSLGGFVHVEITEEEMLLTYVASIGKSLFQARVPKRSRK